MRYRHIELFRTLMMTRSVTRAAAELRTSQPTASRFLGELEREIGFLLFDRRGGKLVPTPEAHAFHEEVQRSFVGLAEIRRVADNIANFRADVLRIASIPSVGFGILPSTIHRFRRRFPDVRISLNVLGYDEVVRDVAAQQCELGFVAYPVDRPGLTATPFLTTSAAVILPAGHPLAGKPAVSANDLDGVPIVSTGRVSLSREHIEEAFARACSRLNIVIETQTGAVACALVREGAAVALLEPLSAMTLISEQIVVRPFTPAMTFEFRVVMRNDSPSARVTDKFLEITRESVADLLTTHLSEGVAWELNSPYQPAVHR